MRRVPRPHYNKSYWGNELVVYQEIKETFINTSNCM